MMRLLHDLFVTDLPLKLLSLALAVLVFFSINVSLKSAVTPSAGSPTLSEKTFYDQPVLVVSSAADVQQYRVTPSQVDLTVQGNPALLQKLQGRDLHLLVDLTGIGTNLPARRRVEVSAPPGVSHTRVVPADIEVHIPPRNQVP